MLDGALLLQTCLNAIYAASYLSLIAVGLVLIFGVMRVVNFAHGELYMVGAYALFWVFSQNGLPFFLGVAVGIVGVGLIGLIMERALFRPMRDNPLGGLIMSIGVLLMLQALAVQLFGVRKKSIPGPYHGSVELFGIEALTISAQRLVVIVFAVVLLGALWAFLKRSKLGWALRAVAQDREAAALQGISIGKISMLAMVLGAALAGAAGSLTATIVPTGPYMGHPVIIAAFIVIIVGGIGSLEGAIVASILYAFVATFVTTFVDGVIADIVGLMLMFAVLIVRPHGLFGKPERA
jgi:branched-chain amino acid transport system permease protein